MEQVLRLVVGLGNPAPSYAGTRHNIGRDFIDFLAQENRVSINKGRIADIVPMRSFLDVTPPEPLLFVKLHCYMNESGPSLKRLMDSKNISPSEILVLLDDFMISFGALRLRKKGSSGGHNGLQSIIDVLGTAEIKRCRIGIGPVSPAVDPAEFVLQPFQSKEEEKLRDIYDVLLKSLKIYILDGFEKAATFSNKVHFQL